METPNLPPRLKEETEEMFAAFCVYAEMGGSRSLAKTAEKIGKPKTLLENWSKGNQWHERVLDMQREVNERAGEKLKERMFENVEKMRDFKNTILEELKTKFHTAAYCDDCGSHKLSIGEMISILNVVKCELGEPTNITRATLVDPANDPFAILLARMYPAPPDESATAA